MQLKKTYKVYDVIALASCTLLGIVDSNASERNTETDWKVDTALLYYSEEGRVNTVEPIIKLTKKIGNEKIFSAKLSFDTLSGSSHNGAAISSVPQTFTGPSGIEEYEVKAGEVPLDPNFRDQRTSLSLQMSDSINRLTTMNYGLAISKETDYQSFGINGGLSRDFNQRNTTLSMGLSLTKDTISPRDGIPQPFTLMSDLSSDDEESDDNQNDNKGGDEEKNVVDALFGITQVINRNTIMQFNYGIGISTGYHNDPYKIVSLIDANTNLPQDYIFESRPDSRTKHSFFWRTKYHLQTDMIDASWRYMTDDWGVNSHTFDFRYRWNMSKSSYLEPHFRYYTQTESNFYRKFINNIEKIPNDVSADYRLGGLDTSTLGAKWGYKFDDNHELSLRFEIYKQSGDSKAADLSSLISQIGYTFYF